MPVSARIVDALRNRGFADAIVFDTEYLDRGDGNHVVPVCLAAKSLFTGKVWKVFADECPDNPLPIDNVLYVSYQILAEFSYFKSMGWELPVNVLDLYAERMARTRFQKMAKKAKGVKVPHFTSLLGSMEAYSLQAMSVYEKTEMRALVMRGFPYTPEERAKILSYCYDDDVVATEELLGAMYERHWAGPDNLPNQDFEFALLRGSITPAFADWEFNGVPFNVEMYWKFANNRDRLKSHLIAQLEAEHGYGAYILILKGKDAGTWKWNVAGFNALVERLGLQDDWMKTPAGKTYVTSDNENRVGGEIFKLMAERVPYLSPLYKLHSFLDSLKSAKLLVGDDGRSRSHPGPWHTNTGRCQVKNFVFSMSKCFRSLVKPGPGRALVYSDLSSAEFGIAAGVTGDEEMKRWYAEAMRPGGLDVYTAMAQLAHMAPVGSTKTTHPVERQMFKTGGLATQYGQTAWSLARRTGMTLSSAEYFVSEHKRLFHTYWEWQEMHMLNALSDESRDGHHVLSTLRGWTRPITTEGYHDKFERNALINFPIQAGLSEIYRFALRRMREAGLIICAGIHDAVVCESSIEDAPSVAATVKECWKQASLDYMGFALCSDIKIIAYPDSFVPGDDDVALWKRIMDFIEQIENEPKPVVEVPAQAVLELTGD
jgi:hypothetical protein